MDLDAIQQIFFQECEEGLAAMEGNFALLRDGDRDSETINGVFRCVHSIKGGAGAFGHERLQAYTHQYETLLDLIRNGTLELTPALLDVVVGAFDVLADHVAAARDSDTPPADAAMLERLVVAAGGGGASKAVAAPVAEAAPAVAISDDFDDLMSMLGDVAQSEDGADAANGWRLRYTPGPKAFEHGSEPLLLLRELTMLGGKVTACDRAALPPIDTMDPECGYLAWDVALPASVAEDDIRAVFEFGDPTAITLSRGDAEPAMTEDSVDALFDLLDSMESAPVAVVAEPEIAAPPPPPPAAPALAPAPVAAEPAAPRTAAPTTPVAPAAQTIRVDLDKLDRLVNLVGELVITQAMLAQRLAENQMGGISELSDLEHLTRELQESTMAIRAQPMKTVFSRVPRIVRELEGETGKRVRLEVDGEMTEVDKTVVERIGEPLTHLIRNAVDHGLEMPDVRVAAGKPAEGVVRLAAAHQSGRIVITVSDDGQGINRARVKAKAIEKGIILPDAVLSDEEIDNLIFAPGFSTAAAITNVSGRGVGMDVVRKNIQALGGRIGIQSREGFGSSFSLSLPLTLAVLDGMIVTVGAQTFVIPLGHIVESLRPDDDTLSRLGPDGTLLDVRGSYVPVLRIADYLGIEGAERNPTNAVLIVVEGDHGQAALLVDTIQDQRQVVVKSLEANYQAIDGVAGATILGDGRVALIADVDALTTRGRFGNRASSALAA
ncbi:MULTISPECIES: chemotaxis protein CheA [unclassified Sphingomonas]|uniref:chemotaxis protein CheA n=1 Tax=unclassified Sphingomonas TaxID=196159 RepID=UPI000701EE8F|nr:MULTISPECIES: chemotaxis protein CheA [unclassified Sphingomonas]KQM57156.1 chemotaxis protein CheA [Sphingomonas sp. Leaf16]KQN10331.1 chemotaxis protein CheA [Sphingomonas sp. Leaf29]KQN18132.1 chemotaxis protein CheA [Sphingomonas sp. Leaf32]